jgi:hypothetical protein
LFIKRTATVPEAKERSPPSQKLFFLSSIIFDPFNEIINPTWVGASRII